MIGTLGGTIRRLRIRSGYTQDRPGARLRVSKQAVSKWENDVSYPDITLLPRLALALHTSVDELLAVYAQEETEHE